MILRYLSGISEAARRDLAFAALTLVLFLAVTVAFPAFASPGNLAGVLDDTSILILLALGQMLVILVRGIDLSVAANLALCGMLAALFNRAYPDAGILPAHSHRARHRWIAGRGERLAGVEAEAAAHRGDAGHDVGVSRRDLSAVAGRLGQRKRDVACLPGVPARAISRAVDVVVAGHRLRRAVRDRAARHPPGARPLCGRRQSRGRRVFRHRRGPHAIHRVHDLRRDRRTVRLSVGGAVRRGLYGHRARLRAAGHRRVPHRRRRDRRWRRIRRGRAARLPVHRHHPQQPAAASASRRSGRCSSTAW